MCTLSILSQNIVTKPKRTVLSPDVAVSRLIHDMQKYNLTLLQRQLNLRKCEVGAAYPMVS